MSRQKLLGQSASQQSSLFNWVIASVVLGLFLVQAGAFNEDSSWRKWWQDYRQDDGGDKKDDDKKDGGKKDVVAGDLLVFVLEKRATTIDQEMILRSVGDVVAAHKLSGFRVIDDDDVDATGPFMKYAELKSLNIEEGGVFLVRGGKVVKGALFPKQSVDLEKFLK